MGSPVSGSSATSPRRYFSRRRRLDSESPASVAAAGFASVIRTGPGSRRGGGWSGLERHRQDLQAAESKVRPPDEGRGLESEVGHAAQHRPEGDLPLDPRERRAEAEVSGPAEGEVTVVLAGNVETIGVGEALGIAVGRAHHRNDYLARADLAPAHLHIGGGEAARVLARTLVPEKLLDRGRDEGEDAPEPRELGRVPQERQ